MRILNIRIERLKLCQVFFIVPIYDGINLSTKGLCPSSESPTTLRSTWNNFEYFLRACVVNTILLLQCAVFVTIGCWKLYQMREKTKRQRIISVLWKIQQNFLSEYVLLGLAVYRTSIMKPQQCNRMYNKYYNIISHIVCVEHCSLMRQLHV